MRSTQNGIANRNARCSFFFDSVEYRFGNLILFLSQQVAQRNI